MSDKKIVKLKVFRFDPAIDQEPHYDIFEVETQTGYSIYNAWNILRKISTQH